MRKITLVGNIDPAFALHRLYQHRDDIGIERRHLVERWQVIVWHAHKAAQQRFEACLYLAAAGGRKRGDGAAMKPFHDMIAGASIPLWWP